MKIVIDDQYHNDENREYTVDESGNIDLVINIEGEVGKSNTFENSNNINYNEGKNIVESDFAQFEEKTTKEEKINAEEVVSTEEMINTGEVVSTEEMINTEEVISDEEIINSVEKPILGDTIISENSWKEEKFSEEKFSRDYNSIYAEIENNLEEKYANKSAPVELDYSNKSAPVELDYSNQKSMYNRYEEKKVIEEKGTIDVFSRLGSKEGVELKGARINLYLLNGVSPKLYDSKFSDATGKVTFNDLPNGCYRIIAIVDRRFFEKPAYYNWNEVTIDGNNKNSNVLVVNKIKAGYYRK